MFGRSIPACFVREHIQKIVNAAEGEPLRLALEMGDDLGLLSIDARNADGTPTAITWTLD